MEKIVVKSWDGRRITLQNGGQVAVGTITNDDTESWTGIAFHRAGEETVRFAITAEAREALIKLLSDPTAGEEWSPPSDTSERMLIHWTLMRDEVRKLSMTHNEY